jgi:hypothetical protein
MGQQIFSEAHSTANKFANYGIPALVVLFVLVVGAVLFVAADKPREASALESSYPPASGLSAAPLCTLLSSAASALGASTPTRPNLGSAAANNNDDEGTEYPLVALVSVLVSLLGSSFLLVLYERPKPGAAWCLLLDDPD